MWIRIRLLHRDADPETGPNPSFQIKAQTLENRLIFYNVLAYRLQIDMDPVPVPDPDFDFFCIFGC